MFKNKIILISGGSGSWGHVLTEQLLKQEPKKIIIFSRGELAQVNMERKFMNDKIEFIIGDVRDTVSVDIVFSRGVDYVFHLAALKHVPICENMPIEAIKTNITGTINLVQAAIKYKVKKFIDVSTDKAVAPSNLYGMTKAVGEKIVLQANNLTNDTHFSCVRGGNVLGSNGSVVPHFINQIKKQNRITITNNDMTRYFLTLNDAIKLLFQATSRCVGGEIFVTKMPAAKILNVAKVIWNYYNEEEFDFRV
jgi:FlaA1/EpsC-like NDP-sugar epimerase